MVWKYITKNRWIIKKNTAVNAALILTVGTREMDQKLKPLPEDLSSKVSTWRLTTVSNSSPREFDALSGLHRNCTHMVPRHICKKYSYTFKNEKITTCVRTSLLKLVFQEIIWYFHSKIKYLQRLFSGLENILWSQRFEFGSQVWVQYYVFRYH